MNATQALHFERAYHEPLHWRAACYVPWARHGTASDFQERARLVLALTWLPSVKCRATSPRFLRRSSAVQATSVYPSKRSGRTTVEVDLALYEKSSGEAGKPLVTGTGIFKRLGALRAI